MKKRIISSLLVVAMLMMVVACGKNDTVASNTNNEIKNNEVVSDTEQVDASVPETDGEAENNTVVSETDGEAIAEAVHEHNYVENVVKEATCTENGTATFTCECGDTYDEEIESTGHDFGDYVADGNASYTADGTKTATCGSCGETDTVADEGSKLNYTYTDLSATKYAASSVNVRDLPSTDGNKLGSLSTNDEVTVTGQCVETGWYRINYNGSIAYVSNNYLGDNKIEPPAPPADNGNNGGETNSNTTASVPNALDYPRGVWHDMGTYKFYLIAYRSSREMGQVQYNVTTYEGMGCIGIHLNTSEDLWALVAFTNSKDSALNAFIKDNQCKCGEPTHGGLYPERGR